MVGTRRAPAPGTMSRPFRILVLNPDPGIQGALCSLTTSPYEVILESVKRPLHAILADSVTVDLLLVNVTDMAEVLLTLLPTMKEQLPNLKVILLCEADQMWVWCEATRGGAYELLPRTIGTEDLQSVIRSALEIHRAA